MNAEQLIDNYISEKAPDVATLKKLAKENGAMSIKGNAARFGSKKEANTFVKAAQSAGVKKLGAPSKELDGYWVDLV